MGKGVKRSICPLPMQGVKIVLTKNCIMPISVNKAFGDNHTTLWILVSVYGNSAHNIPRYSQGGFKKELLISFLIL